MSELPQHLRCQARNRTGEQCRKVTVYGDLCGTHEAMRRRWQTILRAPSPEQLKKATAYWLGKEAPDA